jgi:hypothetical protein
MSPNGAIVSFYYFSVSLYDSIVSHYGFRVTFHGSSVILRAFDETPYSNNRDYRKKFSFFRNDDSRDNVIFFAKNDDRLESLFREKGSETIIIRS